MSNKSYVILYNNILELCTNNNIKIVSDKKTELDIANNIKIGSYERIEIDGRKEGKDYKFIILPEMNKYTKKKNSLDLLSRYQDAYHRIMVICVKEEQLNKLGVVIGSLHSERFILTSYKPLKYNFLTHCHGNKIRTIMSKEEIELLEDSFKLELSSLPKIKYGEDALTIWYFDLIKKGDVIIVDDISDNSGGILLYRYVI